MRNICRKSIEEWISNGNGLDSESSPGVQCTNRLARNTWNCKLISFVPVRRAYGKMWAKSLPIITKLHNAPKTTSRNLKWLWFRKRKSVQEFCSHWCFCLFGYRRQRQWHPRVPTSTCLSASVCALLFGVFMQLFSYRLTLDTSGPRNREGNEIETNSLHWISYGKTLQCYEISCILRFAV